MQTVPATVFPPALRIRPRSALVASADGSFRQRIAEILTGLRWQVREAQGGAEAWAQAEAAPPEAMIVDTWLPDLDLTEFLKDVRTTFPQMDLLTAGGTSPAGSLRGPYRQELLYALRRCQDMDTGLALPLRAAESAAPNLPAGGHEPVASERLPELVGNAACMLEISHRVRLVAPRMTPVLIEGPTGSGKELVARALHRLSGRNRKLFAAINCAAIPEALLEAELFGHTRGAFTGAVQRRTGRIEAADGGTLFLDEIGEMPLGLQSKLLRFVESGELQRVGDNETMKVDVRIVAATHQPLAQQTQAGLFRADLYYRLAVFLIRTPSLAEHPGDLPLLVEHFMQRMGRGEPVKRVDAGALAKLAAHEWPGNVRELGHVLERGTILAGDNVVLTAREIDFGFTVN